MRRVLLTAFLLLSGVARADEPLDGTWLLDTDASDPIDPMMDALGFSTLEKLIARKIAITHVVDDMGDRVRVNIKSALRSMDRTCLLDGVAREEADGGNGEPAVVAYRRAEDGAIVTDAQARGRDGVTVHLLTRRLLLPDGAMLVEIHVEKAGTTPVTLRRIFRRQP